MEDQEVTYDQIGDPKDPLGLRQKAKSVPTGRPDPLGLRSKLTDTTTETSQPKQEPLQFKPMSDWLSIPQGYKPMIAGAEVPIDDHTRNTGQAADRVSKHLDNIDQSVHNLIYNYKEDIKGRAKSIQLGINPKESLPQNAQVAAAEKMTAQPTIVTPEEVEGFKNEMKQNGGMMRDALSQRIKDLSKTNPTEANQLKSDLYRVDAKDRPDNEKQIAKNVEGINKGELEYDPKRGLLYKPHGFFGSLALGYKQKKQAFEDYDFFTKTDNESAIIKELNSRMKDQDPDKPIDLPVGASGEGGVMLGGQPIKPIIGGALAGTLGTPLSGAAAASGISAHEMYKLAIGYGLPANYAAIKKQHPEMPDYTAYRQAKDLTEKQAVVDAGIGAAMGFVGGESALKPSNALLQKAVKSGLTQLKEEGAKKLMEGLGVGAIGGGGQVIKNIMSQKAGLPVSTDEGVGQQLVSGVALTAGMAMLAKTPELLKPKTKNELLHSISKMPDEAINQEFNNLQEVGYISPEEMQAAQKAIRQQKDIDNSIPEHIGETDRLKIQSKIKERNLLQDQIEKVDPAYHPDLKERIKSLNEEIVNISKGTDKEGLQKLVHQEAQAGKIQGYTAELLQNATENELNGYMKDIAEQAHDPNSATMTEETFGKKIVEKAKELYPKVEEPSEAGAGKVPAEKVGGVDVSEHGEDTKTAAGQENGTKPSKLSRAGTTEAKELGKYMAENGQTKVVSSPVERAHETAKTAAEEASHITGKKVTVETNDLLKTWDIGEFDGMPEGSFNEDVWVTHANEAPKGGESFNDFTKRMEQADAYIKTLPEDIHVVTHSKVMRALYALDKTGGKWTDETTNIFLNNKELSDAQDVRGNSERLPESGKAAGGSENVGSNDVQQVPTETSGSGKTQQQAGRGTTQEKGITEGQEKVGEPAKVGITHRQMDELANEYGFDTYEKSPERVKEWDEQAAKKLQEPNALNDLFTKLRNGETPDKVETRMMLQYLADLKAKIEANPTDDLLNQLKRTKDLFNIAGREQGKALRARQGEIPAEESLGDFLIRDMDANKGAPLTEEQKSTAIKEYNDIKKAKEELEQKVAKLEAEKAKAKAEKIIQEQEKTIKREPKKDYKTERKQILDDIAKKWNESKGQLSATFVPYADQLIKIAPDVMKLVANVIAEGVEKLPDVINAVHGQLKQFIPEITEKDVHDVIAGEYTKKQTRSELQEKLYDIRTQARLINKLEALKAGMQPKNEKQRVRRNQEIESLKQQIKELEGRPEKTEAEKLASLKARYKKQIDELESKIAKGDYGPDEKPEPIKLDKEAQQLKDKYIKLKSERQRRLAEQEYKNRPLGKKLKDKVTEVLNVPRTIMASVDLSAPLRQGLVLTASHPGIATKAFVESVKQAISPARFDRWLFDLKESGYYKNVLEKSGLYVADPNNLHLSAKEEAFMTNLAEKIPVLGRLVAGSERAYVAFLNKLRVDTFTMYAENLVDKGMTPENSPQIYEGLAKFVNAATGRGDLGKLEPAAQVLNTAFFSPRLIASRINMLNPLWYAKLPKEIRIHALVDMAKMIGLGTATLTLFGMMPGVTVEADPRSTDFGKIKFGDTRYDIWGGFQQYIRLISQIMPIIGGEKKADGRIVPLGNEYGQHTRGEKIFNFFRSKLAPVPSIAVDVSMGKTAVGEEVTAKQELNEHLVPMIVNDIKDAWQNGQGPMALVYTGLPSMLGIGTTTYDSEGGKGGGAGATGKYKPSKPHKLSKSHK
jgi:broad specificity phosphatase PhoE